MLPEAPYHTSYSKVSVDVLAVQDNKIFVAAGAARIEAEFITVGFVTSTKVVVRIVTPRELFPAESTVTTVYPYSVDESRSVIF